MPANRLIYNFRQALWRFASRGACPSDDHAARTQKAILTLTAVLIAGLAIVWGITYFSIGYVYSGVIPLMYAAASSINIWLFLTTKRYEIFRFSQLLLILLMPFFLQWSLGGFANGSVVMIWSFFTPLAAIFFTDLTNAAKWLIAYAGLIVISGIMDSTLAALVVPVPAHVNTLFFILNVGVGSIAIYLLLSYFVSDREHSHILALHAKEEALASQRKLEASYLKLQENEARIRELMLTDALTGLANRRHLDERLHDEIKRTHRYQSLMSLIMTDVDHFKRINDNYGHAAGDQVLQAFADIISHEIREADFVGRFGGEEFVILLPETDGDQAMRLAERIRARLEQTRIPAVREPVTASFGVATAHSHESAEGIMRRVDQALYESKEAGRNRVTAAK